VTRCRCQKPRETYDLGWYVWGWTSLRTPRWLDDACCGPLYRFWCWARRVGLIQIRLRDWEGAA
jgi:hypothetical protein